MLAVERLSVSIGAAAVLSDVSFGVAAGEAVGIVGESGSGKSMAALAVMRLLPAAARASGRIGFGGHDLLAMGEGALNRVRGARIGIVFQEPMTALDPLRRAIDQVCEPLLLHRGHRRRPARDIAAALLARVGVARPAAYPHQLSGGQRQRVMIAAALACGPALLVADEPTTALDATVQAQILDLLADLQRERGMALLLISHDLGVVGAATARLLVMYAGRVVEQGATASVFARLAHPYTRGLFAASPHAVRDGRLTPMPGQAPDPRALPAGCAFAPRCPRAGDDCVARAPRLEGTPAHQVACWHPYP